MTSETILRTLESILAEINESENAVCYVTSEDREVIKSAIKALEQEPKTGTWSIKEVADALERHGLLEQEPILDKIRTDISRCKTKHECQISEKNEKGKLMISDIFCDVIGIIDKYRQEG